MLNYITVNDLENDLMIAGKLFISAKRKKDYVIHVVPATKIYGHILSIYNIFVRISYAFYIVVRSYSRRKVLHLSQFRIPFLMYK